MQIKKDEIKQRILNGETELYCPKCKTGRRVKAEISKDGAKIRVCTKCGEEIK